MQVSLCALVQEKKMALGVVEGGGDLCGFLRLDFLLGF